MAPHAGHRVTDLRDSLPHRLDRERGRVDSGNLLPQQRGRNTRVRGRPHRVGGRDRLVARVLAEVDEDAAPVLDPPRRRRDLLVADAPLHLLGQGLREAPHLRELELGLDRRHDVHPRRTGGLGVRREPELIHDLANHDCDLAHVRPLPVGARVEVDQQVVRLLDLRDARVPGVQLDAAEVGDPFERRFVVDDGEDRRVPARELDEELVDVRRVLRRNSLLVEELAVDPVRVAHHVEEPAPQVRQRMVRDVEVVADEVALRQPALREIRPCPRS